MEPKETLSDLIRFIDTPKKWVGRSRQYLGSRNNRLKIYLPVAEAGILITTAGGITDHPNLALGGLSLYGTGIGAYVIDSLYRLRR